MKKLLTWKPSTRLIALVTMVALVVMLLPLVRLALYSVPWYDDYMYGYWAKAWMEQLQSPWGAIVGAIDGARIEWYAWQGTYSSIFFMTLMPGIWGEDKYCLGPIFLLILLTVSVFVLVKVLLRDILKADWASCVVMQAITAMMIIMLIYTAQQGFYWYIGGLHYVGIHAMCMLFLSAVICLLRAKKKWTTVLFLFLSMLGALIIAGGNFVSALQGILLLLCIIILGILFYGKRTWLLLPSLCIYVIGFYHNIAAPGNAKRAAHFVGMGCSPVESVIRSFVEAFRYLDEFTGFITLVIMIMLVPIIWHMLNKCDFTFRYPGLVLLCSFCLYATGFTPSLYSMGHAGLSRTLNAVKITYQLLLLLNEVYWLGWLHGYCRKKEKRVPNGKAYGWFYALVAVAMLCIFAMEPNKAGCYSAYGAYYYVHSGETYNFYQEYLSRVEVLKSDQSDVVLEPYRFKPWFLCVGDLSENPGSEENKAIADWYGKNSVRVEYSDTTVQ